MITTDLSREAQTVLLQLRDRRRNLHLDAAAEYYEIAIETLRVSLLDHVNEQTAEGLRILRDSALGLSENALNEISRAHAHGSFTGYQRARIEAQQNEYGIRLQQLLGRIDFVKAREPRGL